MAFGASKNTQLDHGPVLDCPGDPASRLDKAAKRRRGKPSKMSWKGNWRRLPFFLVGNLALQGTIIVSLGGGLKYFFSFTPTWGNDQMGWFNHQLVSPWFEDDVPFPVWWDMLVCWRVHTPLNVFSRMEVPKMMPPALIFFESRVCVVQNSRVKLLSESRVFIGVNWW